MMDTFQRATLRLVSVAVLLTATCDDLQGQSREPRRRATRPRITLQPNDGPNPTNETDLAAGEMLDSLFSSERPSRNLFGKANGTKLPRRQQSVATTRGAWQGRLAENPDQSDGSPPYVLLDRYGGVKRFVEPSPRVDLESRLGQTVTVRRDTGHTLLASQLDLPVVPLSDDELQLAQFTEDESIVAEGPMIVPEGVDPVYLDNGLNFGGCDACGDGVACGSGVCGGCQSGCGLGARPILYARAEYLQWWFDGMDTPPLVLRYIDDPPPTNADQLLSVVFGGNEILDDGRSGFKILVGTWFDDYGKWGLEGDYYGFETARTMFLDGGNGEANPAVGRPFIDTNLGQAIELVSNPGLQGTVTVEADSDFMMSGIRLRHNLCCVERCRPACGDCVDCGAGVNCGSGCAGCGISKCPLFAAGVRRTDVLFGIRHAQLEERLRVTEDLEIIALTQDQIDAGFEPIRFTDSGEEIPVGTTFDLYDDFTTSNEFVGVDFGYLWEWEYQRWSLELLSKLAVGNTRQRVNINGQTVAQAPTDPTPPDPVPGGLLAQRTNIGRYERDELSVLPEINATLGFHLTNNLRLTVGYTFIYWSRVVRPGDQIDQVVNTANVPRGLAGALPAVTQPLLPAFTFRDTDFWAHGLNAGAEYRW